MLRSFKILASNPLSLAGIALIAAVVLSAVFADFIAPFPEHRGAVVDFVNFNRPPEWPYIMGTDLVGRDIFSRIIYAYRISLFLGVVVLGIAVPVGVTVGLVAGYVGGRTEFALMRLTDVFLSVPPLVLAMSIMGVLEPTLTNGMLAVTTMWWPWYTRLVYNITRSEKEEGYVLAAEVIGASRLHIVFQGDSAELLSGDHHENDFGLGIRHIDRFVPLLSRPWSAASYARSGVDGRGRSALPAPILGG